MKLEETIDKVHGLYRESINLLAEYRVLCDGSGHSRQIKGEGKVFPFADKVDLFNRRTKDLPSPEQVEDLPENTERKYFAEIERYVELIDNGLEYSRKAYDFNDNQSGMILGQSLNLGTLYVHLDALRKGVKPNQITNVTERRAKELQCKIWKAAGYDLQAIESMWREIGDSLSKSIIKRIIEDSREDE